MVLFRGYRELILAGLVWLGAEFASVAAIHSADARVAIWLPSGIAVAALLLFPRSKWPPFLSAIFVSSIAIGLAFELPKNVIAARAFIDVLQPPVMVWLVRRFSRGLSIQALQLQDLVGFAFATAAGSLVSVPIMIGFGISDDPLQWVYAAFAVMLGAMVVAPIALTARDRIAGGKPTYDWQLLVSLSVTGAVLFALSLWVLSYPATSLLFLSTSVIVIAAVRHGQLGASVGLFAFALAISVISHGGRSPATFLQMEPGAATVFLQFYMLVLLAVSLPLAALLLSHNRLATRLSRRNRRLRQDVMMLNLAESLSGIGRWRRNLVTGEREMSPHLKIMLGCDPGKPLTDEESLAMHLDGGVHLLAETNRNRDNRHPYSIDMHIRRPDGEERFLKMITVNEFNAEGQVCEMFGVIMDMTDQRRREDALDRARSQAMRLAAEAQLLAQTDVLTGLANRRRTFIQLEKCIASARETGKPLTVIAFDVDHFKQVNDSYGHQTGDKVLKRVAELACQVVRESDLVGRTGGEEFVWILPCATEAIARAAAERLRHVIEVQSAEGGLPPVTVSVGVAVWRDHEEVTELLLRADEALYAAKHNGRNQVSRAA